MNGGELLSDDEGDYDEEVVKNTTLINTADSDYIVWLCNYMPNGRKTNFNTLVLCRGDTIKVESASKVYVLKKRPDFSFTNIDDGEYDLLIHLYKSEEERFTFPEPGGEFKNHHLNVVVTTTGNLHEISITHTE